MRRRWFRIALWIAAGLVALLLLAIGALHLPPTREYALGLVTRLLREQGIVFRASRLDYNLLALDVTLNDVIVRSTTAPDLPPLLEAERLHANLSLSKLLQGKYYVEDAALLNPRATIVIDRDGRDNIPHPPKKEKPSQPVEYLIDRFLLSGGRIRYEDRRQQFSTELPIRDLTIDGNPLTGVHDLQLTAASGGQVQLQNRTLPIRGLAANGQFTGNSADVRRLDLTLGDSTVTLSGGIKSFDDPNFDLKAETTLALASLVEFAGVPQKISGNLRLELAANGPLAHIKARLRAQGAPLTVEQFDRIGLEAVALYDADASRVLLESVNVTSPSGTIRGKGDLALNARAGRSSVNIGVNNLDLAGISRTLRLPVQIASRATAEIAAAWPALEFDKAAGTAAVRLAATRSALAHKTVPVAGALNARAQGDTVILDIATLRALDTTAAGRVTLANRSGLGGNLRLVAPDLAATLAAAEAYLGQKLVDTPIQGAAEVNATLGGTLQSPDAAVSLSAENVSAGSVQGIALDARANYNTTRLAIDGLNLRWRDQALTASGTVGLAGPDPALNLTAAADGLAIETILAGLDKSDLPVAGKIDLKAEVTGSTKHPLADIHLAAADLTAYNETLGSLQAEARLQDQVATLTDLTLRKPQEGGEGTLRAAGTFDIERKTYTIQASSSNFRLTALTLPENKPVRAALQFQVQGQGTVANPNLDLNLAATNVQIDNRDLGSVDLVSKVAGQKAAIALKAPKFGLAASANVGTQAPYPATFTIAAEKTDLANLPVDLNQPLAGTVTATVKGSGDIDNYRKGEASVEIPDLNLTWRGQPIRAEQPLRLHYRDEKLTIDQAVIAAAESRLMLKGELPLDPAATGALDIAAKLDLPTLAKYIPSEAPIDAKGTLTIDGSVRGNLKRIDPNIKVALAGGSVTTPDLKFPVSNIDLQADIADGAADVQKLTAQFGPASFTASGTVPFALLPPDLPIEIPRRGGPARLTAELKSLDLAALPGAPANLSGAVGARVEVQAPRPELEALTGTVAFPEFRAGLGTYRLEQKGVSEIAFDKGTARITRFELAGPQTDIRLSGTAGLAGDHPLDLHLDGKFDASIVSAFTDSVRAGGSTEIQAAVTGTASKPQATGHVQLSDATLSIQQPRIAAEHLDLRLDLAGERATLSRLSGGLNGGTLSGGGTIDLSGGQFRASDLSVKAAGVYLDFPQGLRTVSNIVLTIKGSTADEIVVGGNVRILEGGFTDDLYFDRGLLAALSAPRTLDLTEEPNPLLQKIRLSVAVRTGEPILIDNNLAKAEITINARVVGTPDQPGLTGRIEIGEDGEIRLQERRYIVERGAITFTNEQRIEPSLDIIANTTAQGYDIRLQVSGEPGDTKTTLTSDPILPEPDILALLLTGKTTEEMRGHELEVAGSQVLSYLTGRVGSQIGRGIESATGLSMVRIEPNLIAAEADPSARLTVGQDITRNLDLIYSMDLVNSSDQIYVAEYDISKRFTTRGVRQSDGSFRLDFRHDLRFGGRPEPRRESKVASRRIGQIAINGETYFPQKKVEDKLGVDPGDRYDFFKLRKGLDRVNKLYTKENLLEAGVRLKRDQHENTVDLSLDVRSGSKVDFIFEGIRLPGKVQDRVRDVWRSGVFDVQRAEDARNAIREWLVSEHYLQSSVTHSISTPSQGMKRVLFDIQPGPRFTGVVLEFEGAKQIKQSKLRDIVESQKMSIDVYTRPGRVTELLTRFYREQGFLDAEVGKPRLELDAEKRTGRVLFPVAEGPLYKVREVVFEGNTVFTDGRLSEAVPLPKGEGYRPVLRENALQRLTDLYWGEGYNDVKTEFVLRRDQEAGAVDITFRIAENKKSVARDIVLEGNDKTSNDLVRTQLEIKPGEPVSLPRLSSSRRNLYRTGAYSLVDILREPVEGADAPEGEKLVRLRVRMREVQPFQLRYGAFYDTERGPGAIVDISNRNSLGSARVLGLRARYDSQLHEGRIYFSQPTLRRFPLKTIASPYWRQERNPATDIADPFNVDRVGFSIQQEAAFRDNYIFNYGYRIERSRTYDPGPEPIFDVPLRIASLTATLTRETRDDILDATRGGFMSHALQYSPSALGSQLQFIKYFGQYFRYIPLQKPRIELFTNKVVRPRLVYAAGARLGLAAGFREQEVPLSERFFAGGGTSIRGFEQNTAGPIGIDRIPRGGQALLVINNELRFPLISIFDAVGFVDVGNVWERVADMSPTDIRKAAGLGLRVRTPWFLLRLDYGIKLDRRTGESLGRVFFSIGQAF